MSENCMNCGASIDETDLGVKRCANFLQRFSIPVFVPLNCFKLRHGSGKICGKCAKEVDECSVCKGELIPHELVLAARRFQELAEKRREKKGLSNRAEGVIIRNGAIHAIDSEGRSNFWVKI